MNHRFLSTLSCNSRTWIVVVALAMLTNLTATPCHATPNDGFTTDMKAAVEEATEQDKDILLLFTGSDWCPPCKKLESEVFSQQEFLDGVSDQFVLVMLDFPKDKELPQKLKEQNDALAAKFAISGYPTVIMVDKDLKPFAFSGYQDGGPANYIKLMTDAKQLRIKRDENLAAAKDKTDNERAKLLDAAITSLSEDVATIYYADIIEEIVKIDEKNTLGLRAKWNADADAEMRKVILADLLVRSRLDDSKQTMKFIDEVLGEFEFSDSERLSILQIKLNLARETNDADSASKILDRMISLESLTAGTRQRLVAKKAYLLSETDFDAAIKLLDKQIAAAENPASSDAGYLFLAKGELQAKANQAAQAIKTFEGGIAMTPSNYDLLIELVAAKSDCLFDSDQQDKALITLDDFAENEAVPADLRADALLQKSILMRKLNRNRQARLVENRAIEIVDSPAEKASIEKMVQRMRAKFE